MKNLEDIADFTVVFKTGRLWEYDMVVNTLKEKEIPFQSHEEYASGLRVAMPLRATPGPGVWWAVSVPKRLLEEVTTILSELPIEITTSPDVWHFSSSKKVKIGLKIYVWIVLALTAASLLYRIIDFLLHDR